MTTTIEDNHLVIRIPVNTVNPPRSSSGKTRLIATTHGGVKTDLHVLGERVSVSVNAYIGATSSPASQA